MPIALASAPEQGQLASVRSRNWIVNAVIPSTLPTSDLQGISDPATLVSLASVDDDGLGEEIQVVWQFEPGAWLIEKVSLPDPTGFDRPDRLDAFLDGVRWGASSSNGVRYYRARNRANRSTVPKCKARSLKRNHGRRHGRSRFSTGERRRRCCPRQPHPKSHQPQP